MIAIKKLLATLIIVATVTHNVKSTENLRKEPPLKLIAVLYRTIANLRARLKTCEIRKLLDSKDDEVEEKNRKEFESPTSEVANKNLTQPSTRINKFEATRRPTLVKNVDEDPGELDSKTEKSKTKTKPRFGSRRPMKRKGFKGDKVAEKILKEFVPTANEVANKWRPTLVEYVGEDPGELDATTEKSKAKTKPRFGSRKPTKRKGSKGDEVEEKNPKEFVPLHNEVANENLTQPPASLNKVTTIGPTPDENVDEDSDELEFKAEKSKAKAKPRFGSRKPTKRKGSKGDEVEEKNPKEFVPLHNEVANENLTQPPASLNKVTTIGPTSDENVDEDSDELDFTTEKSKAKTKPRFGSRKPTKRKGSKGDEVEEKNPKEFVPLHNEVANENLTQPPASLNKVTTIGPTPDENVDEDSDELEFKAEKSKAKAKPRFGSRKPTKRKGSKGDEVEEKNPKEFVPLHNEVANENLTQPPASLNKVTTIGPTPDENVDEDSDELEFKAEKSKAKAKPRFGSRKSTKRKGSKGDEVEEKNPKEFVHPTNEVANQILTQPPASINKVTTTIRPTSDDYVDEDSDELDFKTGKSKAKTKPRFDSRRPTRRKGSKGDEVEDKNPNEFVHPTNEVANKILTQPPARINKDATTLKPTSDEYDDEDSDELDIKTEKSKAKTKPRFGTKKPTRLMDSKGDVVEEKNPKEFVPPSNEVANKNLTQPLTRINKYAATLRPASDVDEDSDELVSKIEPSKAKSKPRFDSRRPTKRKGSMEKNPKKFVPPTKEVANKNLAQPPTRINRVTTTIKPTSDEYDDEDSDELDFKTEKSKANTKPRFSSPPMRYTTSVPKRPNTRSNVNKETTLCNKKHKIPKEQDDLKYINIYNLLKLIRDKASAEDI